MPCFCLLAAVEIATEILTCLSPLASACFSACEKCIPFQVWEFHSCENQLLGQTQEGLLWGGRRRAQVKHLLQAGLTVPKALSLLLPTLAGNSQLGLAL